MNFYLAQDDAKKKTKYLILVYILVLFLLTALSTLVLVVLWPIVMGQHLPSDFWQTLVSEKNLPTFLGVGAFIVGGALLSSFIKSRHLSKGGSAVAAALGGVKISPNTQNINERKVINVVEEMAIASGMPVPEVYLLKEQNNINAFAAGKTTVDAVIGVTQGCIDKLTRAQLQGVIGHEFSHILNGDMRLNMRIIMLVHGIEFIGTLGRIFSGSRRSRYYVSSSRSSSRNKGGGAIILAGFALRIIGWLGVLSGKLIQAAVSRQREFLADASAVQFTRDPSSISDALKVIGNPGASSKLHHPEVDEVAHIFFNQAISTRITSLFATHPPVIKRIRAIEPSWDGRFLKPLPPPVIEPELDAESDTAISSLEDKLPTALAILMAAGVMIDQLSATGQKKLSILAEKAADPMEAMAIVLAVIVKGSDLNEEGLKTWQEEVKKAQIQGFEELFNTQLEDLKSVELANQLPLIELAMPALKQLSEKQYTTFKQLLEKAIDLDGVQSVFEQSIFKLVTRYLDVHFGFEKPEQVRFRWSTQIKMEIQVVFSLVTLYGHQHIEEPESAKALMDRAFEKAMAHLGLAGRERILDDHDLSTVFDAAVKRMTYCSLELKQRIVEALAICVEHDGQINEVEKELVLAIAATMNAPIPRLKL